MYDKIRKTFFPILAAIIWGGGYVFQEINTAGTFTITAMRSTVAFPFLMLVILFFNKGNPKNLLSENHKVQTKYLWIGGILCGLALGTATCFQQLGFLMGVKSGKSAFLTALYIILVPILGVFLKRKTSFVVWISAVLSLVGVYLLCITEDFIISFADVSVLIGAFFFAVHIMVIDRAVMTCNGVKMSCIQFITMTVLCWTLALIFEKPSIDIIVANLLPALYLGVLSSGVGFTLQILAQKDSNPTVTTILLSTESVFGLIAGALFMNEVMSAQAYIGCALMFVAVILAQIPIELFAKLFTKKKKEVEQKEE